MPYDILLFLLGLGVGSFLNVLTLRYDENRSLFSPTPLRGRSQCPHCKSQLRWHELVPLLSFALQKGRCRHCRNPISYQYPVVELAAGLLFVAVPYRLATPYMMPDEILWVALLQAGWVLAGLCLLTLAVIDIRKQIIPDELLVVLGGVGLGIAALQMYGPVSVNSSLGAYALLFGSIPPMLGSILAGGIGILTFGIISDGTAGRGMGMGDVKFAGVLGLLLGWPDTLIVLPLAFVVGAVVLLPFLLRGRVGRKHPVPFGPFMVAATGIIFFWGEGLAYLYFALFGIV